ncbi:class I SAM-dependent methyltransferase [Proteus terrae]|nr:rRNA adenine N-6-methyltransferase family protein [Proteus terrae]MBG3090519.1 methyltransferase [Proteus terrae subsp. cibarius]QKD71107.1 methyltransferase [Proteus terrae subsp. cibarius]QKD72934.1 methyltransferase [Proteus terrae subsp. cibarius]UDF25985.1 methyltransferase [Proteus terrae subsp. cibarius]WCG86893.1 methyltransferase [Proteus terrae]
MDISTFIPLSTYYSYVKRFVISPTTMGTIAPSSRWLCYEMLDKLNWQQDLQVAELGAGTGVITQQILKRMSLNSSLDVFEIEPSFATELDKINDKRLRVYTTSAEKLNSHYNMIISGLPFLSIPKKTGLRVLKRVHKELLKTQGCFVLFQYTTRYEKTLSRYFHLEKKLVMLNVPPAWVYYCTPKNKIG